MRKSLILLFLLISIKLSADVYFVSTTGNDNNPGTYASPFATYQEFNDHLTPGDTGYIRGGTYTYHENVVYQCRWYNLKGTVNDTIKIWNYPGETVVWDFTGHNFGTATRYLIQMFECDYVWVKGIRLTNAAQPGDSPIIAWNLTNSEHNLIEFCTVDHIGGFGFNIGAEGWHTGDMNTSNSEYNVFLNCDAWLCEDPNSPTPYGGANGFNIVWQGRDGGAVSNTWSNYTSFIGCRAWWCSDDGWDFYGGESIGIIIDNCWSFWNGFNETIHTGDGQGYKLGPPRVNMATTSMFTITNSLAIGNYDTGFDQNTIQYSAIITFYNCLAYGNSFGFEFYDLAADPVHVLRNNVSYGNSNTNVAGYLGALDDTYNSWNGGVTVSNADFESLDDTQLDNSRQANGDLPIITFGHLAVGSDLIEAGVDVGLDFPGTAPDIGINNWTYYDATHGGAIATPLFINSEVKNSNPSIVEINYNLTLANLVPASSAFSVMVNSVLRTVSSVSISGTRVLLTLASPVVYGNVVSVAYSKPAANPLQTAAGGQAASIGAQPVTNNVGAAIPVYVSSVISNATPAVLEMTYNLTLANLVPASSSFSVMVNSVLRTVSSVSISGTRVLLTLASPVVYGNVVSVAYSKPAANPLQTAAGGQAASIGAQPVTNNVGAAIPVYVSSVISNATPAVLEMTYNLTLANLVPASSAFSVMVNSVLRTVSSVSISGTRVLLTLASPVVYGNVVSVAYSKPASNPLQTAAGGQAASIGAQPVTNNVGAAIPVYVSSVISNATPAVLEMTYNLTLANLVPASSAFSVMVNSVLRTVNSVSISGTRVLLTLASPVVYGNVVSVAYSKPASNPLQTAAGGQAASIGAQPVTNNVGAAIPVYVSSVISNATPAVLEMTYNLTLANLVPASSSFSVMVNSVLRTVSSVSISGTRVLLTLASPVVYGNVVSVAYSKPASNPLQTAAGGQAASIGAQPVTNNVGAAIPVYVSSVISNATPAVLEMTYNLTLANLVPASSAFSVMVNSVLRTVNSVSISGTRVLLTLASPMVYGNVVSVAYNKPAANPLQTISGGQATSLIGQSVVNNCTQTSNQPPTISISSPVNYSVVKAPAVIVIKAEAFDNDGTITKVEFFNGGNKLGETTTAPYTFTWSNVPKGRYRITAAATDNLMSRSVSGTVTVLVRNSIIFGKGASEITIIEPNNGKRFVAPAKIDVTIDSYDPDSIIRRIEYFAGDTKIGESFQSPYSISFESRTAKTFKLTSIAYDEFNEIVASTFVDVFVDDGSDDLNLYPNPNDGRFSIKLSSPLKTDDNTVSVINSTGKTVYQGLLSKEESTKQFDLSHLNSGIYIMIIKGRNGIMLTKKYIKR